MSSQHLIEHVLANIGTIHIAFTFLCIDVLLKDGCIGLWCYETGSCFQLLPLPRGEVWHSVNEH